MDMYTHVGHPWAGPASWGSICPLLGLSMDPLWVGAHTWDPRMARGHQLKRV